MDVLDTLPSFFEVLMEGGGNMALEEISPSEFPDPLLNIPPCVTGDLENEFNDHLRGEEIITVLEDTPSTSTQLNTPASSPFHHPLKRSSVTVNLADRPRKATVIDRMKTTFEGLVGLQTLQKNTSTSTTHKFEGPLNSSRTVETISTTQTFEGPSNFFNTAPTSTNTYEEPSTSRAPTSTNLYKGHSALYCDKVMIESEETTNISLPEKRNISLPG